MASLLRCTLIAALMTLPMSVVAPVRVSHANDAQLEAQRQTLFVALQSRPNDTQLMLRYAQLSAQLGFFEGSISTLERLLDIQPGNILARFHLAVAYYTLGSYTLANVHFTMLLGVEDIDPALQARILQFTSQIGKRTTKSSIKGFVSKGVSYVDENDAGVKEEFFGSIARGELIHAYDLGGSDENEWITEAGGHVLFSYEGMEFKKSVFYVRTGPYLNVDGYTFGLKVRPFIQTDIYTHKTDDDSVAVAAGIQVQNTHSRYLNSFGAVKAGYRWRDSDNADGVFGDFLTGVGYKPTRDFEVRASLFAAADQSQSVDLAHNELGVKLSTYLDLENPLMPEEEDRDKKWRWQTYLQYSVRDFDCACDDDVIKLGTILRIQFENDYFTDLNYAYSYAKDDGGAGGYKYQEAGISFGREFW